MVENTQQSIQSRLYQRYQHAPEGRSLAIYGRNGEVSWRSFGDLYDSATVRARVLYNLDFVQALSAYSLPENDELSTTNLLAVLVLGAIPVLSAPPIVRGRHSNLKDVLKYLIRKTRATMVLTDKPLEPLVEDLPVTHRKVRFIFGVPESQEDAKEANIHHFPAADEIAALQLTSGTTGFPKICIWNHKVVLAALDGMVEGMGIRQDDVFVNWTPLYHDMGLVNNFLFCLLQGVPLVMLSTFEFVKNPVIWLKSLSAVRATMTWSPNFGYAIAANWIRDSQLEGIRLDSVRAFWNAAERIHLETIEGFHRRFAPYGVSLEAMKTNFGMAENVGGATFSDPQGGFISEHLDSDMLFKRGIAKQVSSDDNSTSKTVTAVGVGRPYPGLEVKIISRNRRILSEAEIGEIAFVSPLANVGLPG